MFLIVLNYIISSFLDDQDARCSDTASPPVIVNNQAHLQVSCSFCFYCNLIGTRKGFPEVNNVSSI